jgi:HK97 gp10 family phage protein
MAFQTVQSVGFDECRNTLTHLVPRIANNIMRATVHGVASDVAKDMKSRAPVDSGTLKKAIKAKRAKAPIDKPESQVIIKQGANQKNDAFYWRFVEFGTGAGKGSHLAGIIMPNAQPFVRPAVDTMRANMNTIISQKFMAVVEKTIVREHKKNAKK